MYERVGFEERPDDAHLDQFSRLNVLKWACSMGHKDCVRRSVDKFSQWMADPENDRYLPTRRPRNYMHIRTFSDLARIARSDKTNLTFSAIKSAHPM